MRHPELDRDSDDILTGQDTTGTATQQNETYQLLARWSVRWNLLTTETSTLSSLSAS